MSDEQIPGQMTLDECIEEVAKQRLKLFGLETERESEDE